MNLPLLTTGVYSTQLNERATTDAGAKHLNIRIYLVNTTQKLQYTDIMN